MTVSVALDLLLNLISRSQEISLILQRAKSENRDHLTDDEWATILAASDKADKDLADAIKTAAR